MVDSTLITDRINDDAEPAVKPHLILALDYGVKKWAWRSVIA